MTDKEFWEWCGLITTVGNDIQYWYKPNGELLAYGNYKWFPPTDLNNLFKYAVPKLQKEFLKIDIQNDTENGEWRVWIHRPYGKDWEGRGKDPAVALRKAIEEVIESGG